MGSQVMTRSTKVRAGFGIAAVCLFVLLGPLFYQTVRNKRSFDVAFRLYTEAIQRADYPAAFEFCSQSFRAATSYDEFVRGHRALVASYDSLKRISPGSTTVEGSGSPMAWIGSTVADVEFERASVRLVYELHMEKDGWKVFSYRLEKKP